MDAAAGYAWNSFVALAVLALHPVLDVFVRYRADEH
jgi:hypothetical protein